MAFTRKKFALGFEFPEAYFRIVDYYENETGLVVALEIHTCKAARMMGAGSIGIEYIYFHSEKAPSEGSDKDKIASLYKRIQETFPESSFDDSF